MIPESIGFMTLLAMSSASSPLITVNPYFNSTRSAPHSLRNTNFDNFTDHTKQTKHPLLNTNYKHISTFNIHHHQTQTDRILVNKLHYTSVICKWDAFTAEQAIPVPINQFRSQFRVNLEIDKRQNLLCESLYQNRNLTTRRLIWCIISSL